ncbi:hypothetical protein FVEN_g12637 [Fusarium venenatum]|nr:hypothetical protein FVEN_g12637 [Fusarium venenatum]
MLKIHVVQHSTTYNLDRSLESCGEEQGYSYFDSMITWLFEEKYMFRK